MPQPPFLPEIQRTKKQQWRENSTSNVIVLPVSRSRKPGNRTTSEMKAFIVSNAPTATEDQRLRIVAMWRRGVRIAWIAKAMGWTVWQIEAVLWLHVHGAPEPGDGNTVTVRESRSLHLVARRAA